MAALDIAPDTNESTPASFNLARYRILATHWPGLPPPPPWQHVGTIAAAIVADEGQAA